MISRVRKSFSFRQALMTVLAIFLLGTLISVAQIWLDLRNERQQIDRTVGQVLNLLRASAEQAAFNLDKSLAQQVVQGLFEYEPVFRAEIRDDFGERLAFAERAPSQGRMSELAKQLIGDKQLYSIPLLWKEGDLQVGRMEVLVDSYQLAGDFFDRALLILISGLIRNLILAVVLALLFHFTLTRPLMRTAESLARITPEAADRVVIETPKGHDLDELGLLVDTGNQVLEQYRIHLRQQRQARDELQQLRNLLSNVINSMPSVLIGVDAEGRVIQWNNEAIRATGIEAGQAMGRELIQLFPQLGNEIARVRQAIAQRKPLRDKRITLPGDREQRLNDVTVYPLVSNGVEGAVIRVDDVTERVRIEEIMVQTEKMLSVGGLAAGMAHEINNPLAGILQNVQVMRNRLLSDMGRNRSAADASGITLQGLHDYLARRDIPQMLEMIMESGQRAARIVDNMLGFSRKSSSAYLPRDLAKLIDDTLELAANDYDLKKHYDFRQLCVKREYQSLPAVPCESDQIQQVLLNLLKNGAQAMRESGAPLAECGFIIRLYQEGDFAHLEVEDNGPGMEESVRRRIFEPFFTTKPPGVGTGLGLSVAYFIVTENHGGKMRVESTPGVGTRFVILLPLTSQRNV